MRTESSQEVWWQDQGRLQCYVLYVSGPQNLAEQLHNLNPVSALRWGVLTEGRVSARIVPKGKVKKNEVSRTRDNFEYPSGSAIMMLDIDDVLPVDELWRFDKRYA